MNYETAFYLALAVTLMSLLFAYLVWSVFYRANRYDADRVTAARKKAQRYKELCEAQQELLSERAKKIGLLHNEVVRLNDAADEAATAIDHLTNALATANQQINRLSIKAAIDSVREGVDNA